MISIEIIRQDCVNVLHFKF